MDVKVIDIHEVSVLADYFVIASGSNQNQVQAMVDNVKRCLQKQGMSQNRLKVPEIQAGSLRITGDLIIHVFDEENRLFYDLKKNLA